MKELTQREEQILSYMVSFKKSNGYYPTVRDVCSDLNIKSTSTVHAATKKLRDLGIIKQGDRKHGYTVIEDNNSELHEEVINVPIVGRVAAGQPILAEQNIEGYFPIPAGQVNSNCFMLSVHGDSMIEAGILNGDYILVQQQNTANNGEIVVAMVDGEYDQEATVKAFYKEDGHIRLQPKNSSMDPIIVPNCTIVGKVKGVFRYL